MKKIILFALMTLFSLSCFCQSDSYKNKNRAYIMAQDFVKKKLTYPKEAKFDSNVVHETDGYGKCIVIGKVTAKNAYGVRSEYVYKIWLEHNGKDWTKLSNWMFSKMIIEDVNTGKQQTFYKISEYEL